MTPEKKQIKLIEYSERNIRWSDNALRQLGYSINLFTTMGVSFLAYLTVNKDNFPKFSLKGEFDLGLTLYLISLLFLFSSTLLGFISILSRLSDFRITRHITLIRKINLQKNKNPSDLSDNKILDLKNVNYYSIFNKNVICSPNFIIENDLKSDSLKSKFDELRKVAAVLGNLTWVMHKGQIFLLFAASVIFGFTVLI